jgi:vacuolar-type H+-ATPase subunit E/Vma4
MAEMEVRLEESLGQIDSEAIRRRAERVAEQARQKAERAAERARLRAERAERRWQRVSGQRSRPSPSETVSDEERMRVLRLVEEGKITPEQASELLAALEGR